MRILYYHFPNLKMIDRFIYKCCDVLDRYTAWMNNIFLPQPKKKKNERYKSNRKISARTIQKS